MKETQYYKFIDVVKVNRILFDVGGIKVAFYVQHFRDYSFFINGFII